MALLEEDMKISSVSSKPSVYFLERQIVRDSSTKLVQLFHKSPLNDFSVTAILLSRQVGNQP